MQVGGNANAVSNLSFNDKNENYKFEFLGSIFSTTWLSNKRYSTKI